MVRKFCLLLAFLFLSNASAEAQKAPLTSTASPTITAPSSWKNQRGSELKIATIDSSGAFNGEYINNAAGFDCQGVPFDVSGHNSGNDIAFSVTWKNATKNCGSITVWHGTLTGDTMNTTWELAYGDDKTGNITILSGQDIFQRN